MARGLKEEEARALKEEAFPEEQNEYSCLPVSKRVPIITTYVPVISPAARVAPGRETRCVGDDEWRKKKTATAVRAFSVRASRLSITFDPYVVAACTQNPGNTGNGP